MPGSGGGDNINTVGGNPIVLPKNLCKAYTRSHQWASRDNQYHDGSSHTMSLVTAGRRQWSLTRRLTPANMATLRAFWKAHPTDAFYFYDPFEVAVATDPGTNWSAVGAPATGRYPVVFTNNWTDTAGIGRSETSFSLQEVA